MVTLTLPKTCILFINDTISLELEIELLQSMTTRYVESAVNALYSSGCHKNVSLRNKNDL